MFKVGVDIVLGVYVIVMIEMNLLVECFLDSIYYMVIGFIKMFGYIGIGVVFIYIVYK